MKPHTGLSSYKSPVSPAKKPKAKAVSAEADPKAKTPKREKFFSKSRDICEDRSIRQKKNSTQHQQSSNSSNRT